MKVSMADIRKHFSEDVRILNPDLMEFAGVDMSKAADSLATAALPFHALNEDKKRTNKFGAERTKIGDITFDSKKEARRYLELKTQEDAGEISDLQLQVEFVLVDGFEYQGQKIQSIKYKADFTYWIGNIWYIEDVKSVATSRTADFRLRWRLLLWHCKDDPAIRCITTGD